MTRGFDGAVLCGGQSRRMGTDKALVEIGGQTMAFRVADALERGGATTVATVGGDAEALGALGHPHVVDDHPGDGPLGAIVTALGRVGAEPAVAVLACDLVTPSASAVADLVDRLLSGNADAVVARVDGRAQWAHAVWRRRVVGVLASVFESGERSLFGAVHGLDVDFWDRADAAPFRDADVPGDLPLGP